MYKSASHLILSAFAIALALPAPGVQAQVERITLRVDGLACPFCAYGLEKKLKALKGFEEKTYEVKINEGKVLFGWRDDNPLDIVGIETAVDKAGFTLRGIRAKMVGKIARDHETYLFVLPKPLKQRFVLYEPQAVEDPNSPDGQEREDRAPALTDERAQRLNEIIGNNEPMRINGPVHLHRAEQKEKAAWSALGIETLKPLERPRRR